MPSRPSTTGSIPFAIDNVSVRLADVLRTLLAEAEGTPADIATAYFSVQGYGLLADGLKKLGALRLLLGHEPAEGREIGLKPTRAAIERMQREVDALPFDEQTLRLVENLIAHLRAEKVQVRLFDEGFLHAKAYMLFKDRVGPNNLGDRMRPYTAIVGSSNLTGPGLTTNRELNLVHRVFTGEDEPADNEAAQATAYLRDGEQPETILNPSGVEVPSQARRAIKSEVGGRAILELNRWFEQHWAESIDFKDQLIDLLNASKFGQLEYSPYQIYLKTLYTYLQDQLDDSGGLLFGRSAVELTEFQEEAVRKARRILQRYDGVLIADSVGLGKTWIGKKLLEDFAYHQRMKALVVCPASLREMWRRELAEAAIAGSVVGMEEMGRDDFDAHRYGDSDVILVDESHNFRNDKANRYLALDDLIQRHGGRGREGQRKKLILLSATPINNDLYDLLAQIRLFTQNQADYFREAGIGDLTSYFRHARRLARQEGASAGEVLFNLLDEFTVRNTRPYIRTAFPNATLNGEKIKFPERQLKTLRYSLESTYSGLYQHIVNEIEALSLAPYHLEKYRKQKEDVDEFEEGRQAGLVGIFKTRFLKRLESSIQAFRLSVQRALVFEEAYLDFLLSGRVIASKDFWKMMRIAKLDVDDETTGDGMADYLETREEVQRYLETLESVDLNEFRLRDLRRDVERDIQRLRDLASRTEPLVAEDAKLQGLKELLADELKGRKVLIFSVFKDTTRYVHAQLTSDQNADWREQAGEPHIRRIDSGNHPDERQGILRDFAPVSSGYGQGPKDEIDILVSTDVLSEGQNLQDCGVLINYDLTWNPIRLVQRSGRIDRLGGPHDEIAVWNMFPEDELESLLRLVDRLSSRLAQLDDIGFLDASVLGEVVHPRTYNTLRRIEQGDVGVLDEEEARAELAGPEMLLKQLREMLDRQGAEEVTDLPDGIHSGLRRDKCNGIFFYFKAPRPSGEGWRHLWRYIDAGTGEITDNRYRIAQMIQCHPDEPRHIGDHDVFALQRKVIDDILRQDRDTTASAVVASAPDAVQLRLVEDIKEGMRRGDLDREPAKQAIRFLSQPAGRALVQKLKALRSSGGGMREAMEAVLGLSQEYGKQGGAADTGKTLREEDLHLVCFEYVSA
ncbi:MAG: helicase-related protein [Phycisphaeraceae bacterium]